MSEQEEVTVVEEPSEEADIDAVVPMGEFTPKTEGGKGASAEWMRQMTKRRMELAKKDPSKKGGRPKIKYTKAEVEARALERMMPKALKVLDAQLDSKDERVRQSAAVKVMEYVKGKPTQNVRSTVDQVSTIVYQSAAWRPTADGEIIEGGEVRELPPADDE